MSGKPLPAKRRFRFRFGILSLLVFLTVSALVLHSLFKRPMAMASANRFFSQTGTEVWQEGKHEILFPPWQQKIFGADNLTPIDSVRVCDTTQTQQARYWQRLRANLKVMPVMYLELEEMTFTGETWSRIGALPKLKYLGFSNCKITSLDLLVCDDPPNYLIFWDCGVTLDQAEKLRAMYPETFLIAHNEQKNE